MESKSEIEVWLVRAADELHAGDNTAIGKFEVKPRTRKAGKREVKYFDVFKDGSWFAERSSICTSLLCICREMLESNDYLVQND